MPKKHTPNYTLTKPSYVHPSLQSSRSPSSSSTPPPPHTVNERIQQLRREQTPRATAERRDEIIEVVTNRTVPPELRRILHLAEVDAPRPKPGNRSRATPRQGARPPPGPAAPNSWLLASRHAPAHVRNLTKYKEVRTHGGDRFCQLAKVYDVEYKRLPSDRSLIHQCLRTFATNWEELVEYEQHYLSSLPVPLKEILLVYLSFYGSEGCLSLRSLKILFSNGSEVEGGSGSEDLRFLDLTKLLNPKYTLEDVQKSSTRPSSGNVVAGKLAELDLGSPKGKQKAAEGVADSWEDEADSQPTISTPSTLSIPVFSNLTHLSLARPGSCASWTGLLSLSTKLNTLTHLSLAYWPIPSTTPNATTTSMVSGNQKVALGGSHFYSELDNDWHEAANILRRLSQNTYCLKWLDLEGCAWLKALTWRSYDTLPPSPVHRVRDNNNTRASGSDPDQWTRTSSAPGPDFNGSWRQIEYLNFFQGWIPKNTYALRAIPAGVVPVQLLSWLREHGEDEGYKGKLHYDWTELSVNEWVEREKVSRSVAVDIRDLRKLSDGKWCQVDHGWSPVPTAREKDKNKVNAAGDG